MKAVIRQPQPATRMRSTQVELDEATINEIKYRVEEEISTKYETIYRNISADVVVQTLAFVFYALEVNHGWKQKRLTDFESGLKDIINVVAHKESPLIRGLDADLLAQHLLNDYGINLKENFKPIFDEDLENSET